MYRTKTCGELRLADVNQTVTLAGWVQRIRKMGGMTFIDLRDRYGITQLAFNQGTEAFEKANSVGREYVLQATGKVILFAGLDSIRDCIAFPKNNQGKDVMLGAPGVIDQVQLDELQIDIRKK